VTHAEGEDAEGVGDHGEDGSRRVDVGEETLHLVRGDGDGADGGGGEGGRPRESTGERVIAIERTPPLHARVYYDDIPDNDNPWA